MKKLFAILALALLTVGCAKQIQAPVPGSNSTPDAIAFRIAADAQAALHSIKTWEQCATNNFPQTIDVDGSLEPCDPAAGPFPVKFVPLLNTALGAYNQLAVAGKAFHDGLSTDSAALETLETQLQNDVTSVITAVGGK